MEPTWLAMAKRLQALAETGLQFSSDQYDRERYQEIASIALEMMAQLGNVPIEPIKNLLSTGEVGYVTPKVEVRGAIIQDDKILLVQEKEDGLWALPGGYADVGLSPAENVEKEVLEEAGIAVKARYLYAVRHKAKGPYPPDVRDFYKLHFICHPTDQTLPQPGAETTAAQYFPFDQLPELAIAKVLEDDIVAARNFLTSKRFLTHFD